MTDAINDPASKQNHELAKVLNRINTLMGEAPAGSLVPEKDIPQLTEIYEGEPLSFTARSADEFLKPNEISSPVGTTLQPEVVEALLAEMMPVIQNIIKKAVQQDLENAQQPLQEKLEKDILQALREKLLSRLA